MIGTNRLEVSYKLMLYVLFLLGALGIGLGVGAGVKLLTTARLVKRSTRNSPAGAAADLTGEEVRGVWQLAHPRGAPRATSVNGFTKDSFIRHRDGSYTRGYRVEMATTLYSSDEDVDRARNEIAKLLAAIGVPNTIVQFRHKVEPDWGERLLDHIIHGCQPSDSYLPASKLHMDGIAALKDRSDAGDYQKSVLTMWVRVPVRHDNDSSWSPIAGVVSFFPFVADEIKRGGARGIITNVGRAWTRAFRARLFKRFLTDEEAAQAQARLFFTDLEAAAPGLRLTPLAGDELKQGVVKSHRRDASAADVEIKLPMNRDIRSHLCAEEIRTEGDYVMHGRTPAGVVSLFRPPTPVITADMMRWLTINPGLVFEHTTVAEFITLDQERAQKQLGDQFKSLTMAQDVALRRSPDPEAQEPDAYAAREDIKGLRKAASGNRATLIRARVYTVVYGPDARNADEKRRALDALDDRCRRTSAAYAQMAGANPVRERKEALRQLYKRTLVGELDSRETGRERMETTAALARLAPFESVWRGDRRPHTLVTTPSRHVLGFDLYDRAALPSPVAFFLGGTGAGKTIAMILFIVSMLHHVRRLRVAISDYGGSYEPMLRAFGARAVRFSAEHRRTINSWDYPELGTGVPPSMFQKKCVVDDCLLLAELARTEAKYRMARNILHLGVEEVYRNELPRNRKGRRRHEPRLSHLLDWLDAMDFDGEPEAEAVRRDLILALSNYRDDPLVDSPTHPDFIGEARISVFEMKSLEQFPDPVRNALANRMTARMLQMEGYREPDGTRTKMLGVFDEVQQTAVVYPQTLVTVDRWTRTGRKEGFFLMLGSQSLKDLCGTPEAPNPIGHSLMENVGVRFIGMQNSGAEEIARILKLNLATVEAINSINNEPGRHSQFVGVWGAGVKQRVEKFQIELTPLQYWTYTTDDDERNARARLAYLRPEWTDEQIHYWLASTYPRGLVAANLKAIDERLLDAGTGRAVQAA